MLKAASKIRTPVIKYFIYTYLKNIVVGAHLPERRSRAVGYALTIHGQDSSQPVTNDIAPVTGQTDYSYG